MSLVDYSDLEQEITNAPEPKILPRGSEIKARIIAVYSGVNEEADTTYYRLMCDVPDDLTVKDFQFFMNDLKDREKMSDKHFGMALGRFNNFASCFGLDYSTPFSWEDDLVGLEGWVILGVKKDDEYGDKNTVSRFVVKK